MENTEKVITADVQCKILSISPSDDFGTQDIRIEFRIGERVWYRLFHLNYPRPISMEEFKKEILSREKIPADDDFLVYVKEEADKPFILNMEREEQE